MFKIVISLAVTSLIVGAGSAQAQTKPTSLEERVAELEANSSLNVFSFRGGLLTRWDDLSAKQTKGAPTLVSYDNKNLNYWRMKFWFDADANVSKYIKVYSRFTTSKFFNSQWRQNAGTVAYSTNDLTVSDSYSSSAVYLEKAYADLTIPDSSMTFSIGRLPTVDGSPYDYYDNRARLGTYPMMSYNSPLDGMSLTYRLDSQMPQNQKLAVRVIYTPLTQVRVSDNNSGPYLSPPTSGGATATTGNKVNTNLDGFAGQLDYSITDSGLAESANFIVQHLSLNPIAVGNDLSLQFVGTTVALDLRGIGGSRLDLAVSSLSTTAKSVGGLAAAGGLGFGVNSGDGSSSGVATLATLRYRFTGWHIGGEYLTGSRNAFVYQGAAKDLTDFYATPGTGVHAFLTKNFTDMLSLRLGYTQQDYKYTPLSLGANYESDKKVTSYYANMRLDF